MLYTTRCQYPLINCLTEGSDFDWNGNVRAKRAEKKYFSDHDEPLVHSQRCDACRIIANRAHIGFELAESKVGIQTHQFDEFEELGELIKCLHIRLIHLLLGLFVINRDNTGKPEAL